MQPYLFPYIGYFQLIDATDRWVVFDTPQFIRHGWVNRNRILHPSEGWQYFIAPLAKHSRGAPIHAIRLSDPAAFAERLVGQLGHYRKRAPHYAETIDLVRATFATGEERLTQVCLRGLELCFERFGLALDARIHTELQLDHSAVEGPGDWALEIARALGSVRYVNPISGAEIFNPSAFEAAGIELRYLRGELPEYSQGRRPYEAGLSILDLLMWNSPDELRAMLPRYEVVTPEEVGP